MVNQNAPALADQGHPALLRPDGPFARDEEGIDVGRGVDAKTVGTDERKIRLSGDGDDAILEVLSATFTEPSGNNDRPSSRWPECIPS